MGYGEKRGDYYRGRYWIAPGVLRTVEDANGNTIRYTTKREAAKAANDLEAKVREVGYRDPNAGKETFGEYVNRWYAAQELATSTMQNYKHHLEEHLLPEFEDKAIADIKHTDVAAWEKKERKLYAASSVKTWHGTLHLILSDAVEEGLRDSNPASQRRGRGKRAGRSRNRGPEKVVTDALGILLTAERASLLSGRDDAFVAVVLKGYTGMRWGEVVGLERQFVRPGSVRVEWQLYELDTGSSSGARPRMTHTGPSTPPSGCRDWSRAIFPVRSRQRARAMGSRTSSVATVPPTEPLGRSERSWSTSPAEPRSPRRRSRTC